MDIGRLFGVLIVNLHDQLQAGLFISLISVWLLVGVFAYLNYYTRRRYFSIWTVAWLFYAVYLTLSYSLYLANGSFQGEEWWATMFKQWSISAASVFMLWGGLRFLGRRIRQVSLGLFLLFLVCWSVVANCPWLSSKPLAGQSDRLALQMPIFVLIGLSSLVTVWGFFQYRRRRRYMGAGLLCMGFTLWGLFVGAYPFLERWSDHMSTAFFCASVLQMFIAVNMIILVLEQIRFQHDKRSANQLRSKEREAAVLQNRIVLTEKRYRLLFEQSSEPIIITTQDDLRIVGINLAAARVLGTTVAQACQTSLQQWMAIGQTGTLNPRPGVGWFDSLCHERIQTIRRTDGSQVRVEVVGSAVDFAGDTAFQFYFREVTERSRLEQQLRQAEKLSGLGQMISGVVHELNNPLSVTCGFLELSLLDPNLPEQTRQNLAKALAEGHRAARLLRNFLNLAREGGATKEYLDLNGIVNNVIELRRSEFKKAQLELAVDLPPKLPCVLASLDQIQQILIILLNNARQALEETRPPRQLRLSTRQNHDWLLLVVEDNGPGVPPDLRLRIFEPFFTTKPAGVGTGLGLSLAHSFAMEHRGRIYADDSPLGGARFTLELPLPIEAAPVTAPGLQQQVPLGSARPTAAPACAEVLA